jgi:1-acyl-sn-glycerol-3-phosphate acyltransferase
MAGHSLAGAATLTSTYRHSNWEFKRRVLRWLLRYVGVPLLVRFDCITGIENVPAEGPAILMINHIALVDPIMVLHSLPRNVVPLAKIEVYRYPVVGIFPRLWGVIPVRREEVDRRAIQQCLEVLRAGEIVLVAPEGTRSPALQKAREGVAYLSSRTGVPVIPVAVEGTRGFPALRGTKRWREPGVRLEFGRPFRFRADLRRAKGDILRQMTDEAMYILAAMLPEQRRGVYANLSQATQETIEWV